MAILHQAQVVPTKLELLQSYLHTIEGLGVSDTDELTVLGAYRFDDPAGEVGIETHLLSSSDGRTLHIPLTYRAAPDSHLEPWLVGTTEHSVLGTRWCYDGVGDPVYQSALFRSITTNGTQARLEVLTDDGVVERKPTVHVRGSGGPDVDQRSKMRVSRSGVDTTVRSAESVLTIHHAVGQHADAGRPHLSGTWPGVSEPTVLATITKA